MLRSNYEPTVMKYSELNNKNNSDENIFCKQLLWDFLS